MSLPDLAALLWRQRELLERLAYRMVCEQMIIVSGRTSWLSMSSDDVQTTLTDLTTVEMQRSLLSDQVAAELGLPAGCTLEDIAAHAQPPWTTVFLEHRDAMVELSDQLRTIAQSNQKLLEQGTAAMEAAMEAVLEPQEAAGAVSAYDQKGRTNNAMTNWAQGLNADL